jgi:hypothetical protein
MNPYYVETSHNICDFCRAHNIPTASSKKHDVDICRLCLLECREAFNKHETETAENHKLVVGMRNSSTTPTPDAAKAKTAMEAPATKQSFAKVLEGRRKISLLLTTPTTAQELVFELPLTIDRLVELEHLPKPLLEFLTWCAKT